jgi:SLA1 homology domain 1, SHD1
VLRDWTDDTGDYRVRGRLKVILPDRAKIRILKTNGKYTTVPLDRLSAMDREFVERHLSVELALLASISR